jgi:hypothetical protein
VAGRVTTIVSCVACAALGIAIGGLAGVSMTRSRQAGIGTATGRMPSDGAQVAIVSVDRKWHVWAQANVSAAARVSAWGSPSRVNLVIYRSRGPNVVLLDPDFTAKGGKVAIVWLDGNLDAATVTGVVYPTSGRDGFIASNQEVFAALVLPDGTDLGSITKGDILRVVR